MTDLCYTESAISAAYGGDLWPESIVKLEDFISRWLATNPGSFISRGACGMYEKALQKFNEFFGRRYPTEKFEIALSHMGYRAGHCISNGALLWVLVLTSSLETALERLAASETRKGEVE